MKRSLDLLAILVNGRLRHLTATRISVKGNRVPYLYIRRLVREFVLRRVHAVQLFIRQRAGRTVD